MEGHFDSTNMLDCYAAKSFGARSKNATKFRNRLQSIKSAVCTDQKIPQEVCNSA